MDEETRKRLEAVEARLVALENRPVATLEVTETKPEKESKRGTNPRNLTPEQKVDKVRQLRAGKAAAKARRETEAKAVETPEARAEKDARADMVEAELPEDETGIINRWDNTLSVPQKSKMCKKIGLDGKLGASTWADLPQADKAIIIKAQNAKSQAKVAKKEGKNG